MKKIIVSAVLLLSVAFAFGQRVSKNDPTYSDGNYKHPNKATYARKHNSDRHTELKTSLVRRNENYKQPNNTTLTSKVVLNQTRKGRKSESYKHPNGL